MTLENKKYNSYEDLKEAYTKSAENLQSLILELDALLEDLDLCQEVMTKQEIKIVLNKHLNKISDAYSKYARLKNESIEYINQELEYLEEIQDYDGFVIWNEEEDQINKEEDYLNQGYATAKSSIEKYAKKNNISFVEDAELNK